MFILSVLLFCLLATIQYRKGSVKSTTIFSKRKVGLGFCPFQRCLAERRTLCLVITSAITVVHFNNSEIKPTGTARRCFFDCFGLPITVFYPASLSTLQIMAIWGSFSSLSCSHYLPKDAHKSSTIKIYYILDYLSQSAKNFQKSLFLLLLYNLSYQG